MVTNAQASKQGGFSLLELALAIALSAALLTAFFSASFALMQGLLLAADGVRGPVEGSEAMDQIVYDLEQATSFTASTSFALEFQTPGGKIGYRLYANDSASRDVILERAVNDASRSIGPRRMIANFNPYGATFILNGAPSLVPKPLFGYNVPLGSGEAPKVDIYLILQPNQTAPINYLRTKAHCGLMTKW